MAQLQGEAVAVENEEHYDYNIDAIRQIQEAKVEIQQDGFNYTIDEVNGFKHEPPENIDNMDPNIYNEYASEVYRY